MINQIIGVYQEEIRYLDLYYSSERITGYFEELAWVDHEIERTTGAHSLSDQNLLPSLVRYRDCVIGRIHKCISADISKEKEHLRACIIELEKIRLGAVV